MSCAGCHGKQTSIDNADRTASAEFLNPGDEISVWLDIIAFRLHHHHEIALAFHIKQYSSFALAFDRNSRAALPVAGTGTSEERA